MNAFNAPHLYGGEINGQDGRELHMYEGNRDEKAKREGR